MALRDRYVAGTPEAERRVECRHYEPLPGSRRCKHYLDGGACARPDEFMCVEWLRANGHTVPAPAAAPVAAPAAAPVAASAAAPVLSAASTPVPDASVERDLLGQPLAPRLEKQRVAPAPAPAAVQAPASDVALVRHLTDEEITSFRALGVEVCLASEHCGEVWIVPEYTGRGDRRELRVDHAATLTAICAAFPGAKVVSFTPAVPAADGGGSTPSGASKAPEETRCPSAATRT